MINEVEVLLPKDKNEIITKNFLNAFELSLFKKNSLNIEFNINTYKNKKELNDIIDKTKKPGKIYVGPISSDDSKDINRWCSSGVIFFSFASDRSIGSDCVYLINFFPEDEINALFDFFSLDSKIALLYPENEYGNYINSIIDQIAIKNNIIIVNKVSYKEDLTNARNSIKKLSKYEDRRKELERQKKLLEGKNDEISIRALKKIKKFETIGELDFTHIILPDYNVRLLEIAPLLPFYDIDPNKIQFVGTGVWDDGIFFDEPSLQGAIFPGINLEKRKIFMDEYSNVFNLRPIRTITIIHDLVGILDYIYLKNLNLEETFDLLNNPQVSFEGLDGFFKFKNNLVTRELEILKIKKGTANSVR